MGSELEETQTFVEVSRLGLEMTAEQSTAGVTLVTQSAGLAKLTRTVEPGQCVQQGKPEVEDGTEDSAVL